MMRTSSTPIGTGQARRVLGSRPVRVAAALLVAGVVAVTAGLPAGATGGGSGGKPGGGSGEKITVCVAKNSQAAGNSRPTPGGEVWGDFTWTSTQVKASSFKPRTWDIVPAVKNGSGTNLTTTFNGLTGAEILADGCKLALRSTGLYVYPKDDAKKPAAWENSGRQVLVATWTGWRWETALDAAALPAGVCGAGWGVQQDQVWGPESVLPDVVDRKKGEGVLGWPPVEHDLHSELGAFLTVPDCAPTTPSATPKPTPTATPKPTATPTVTPTPTEQPTSSPEPTETPTTPPTPEQPDALVVRGAWEDGTWTCDDDTVKQTRTVTTTPYVLVGDAWVLDVANAQVATEGGTRDLTADEVTACETPVVPPATTPPASPSVTPSVTPTSEVLAATPTPTPSYTSEVLAAGSGGSGLAATGSTVLPVLLGGVVLVGAGVGLVLYRRRSAHDEG